MTQQKTKNRRVAKKNGIHYVDNDMFLKHMKDHIRMVNHAKRNKHPTPPISDYIGECIVAIANKLANRPNFVNYPFKEEMIAKLPLIHQQF